MDLLNKTISICQKYNIKPARSFGQSFLIDESVYENIIEAAEINKNDIVLEVGPGLGFLTRKLSEKAKKVYSIELDKKIYSLLIEQFRKESLDNVIFYNEDVLDFRLEDNDDLQNNNFKIVANLPYNITSIFLRRFVSENKIKPNTLVLMLQKEVVKRIVAKPPKMSLLALSIQAYSNVSEVVEVKKDKFYPIPEVDSAVLKIEIYKENIFSKHKINEKNFFQLLKFGFSAKRKMLKNNLAGGYKKSQNEMGEIIKKTGVNEKIRAEALTMENWLELYRYFY